MQHQIVVRDKTPEERVTELEAIVLRLINMVEKEQARSLRFMDEAERNREAVHDLRAKLEKARADV
jgi:hypothetical protein